MFLYDFKIFDFDQSLCLTCSSNSRLLSLVTINTKERFLA